MADEHTGTMDMSVQEHQPAPQAPVQEAPKPFDPVTQQQQAPLAPQPQQQQAPPTPITQENPTVGMPERVTIILEDKDEIPPTGQMVGVNGYVYCLKPGVPISVPRAVVSVLEDAIVTKPIVDPNTKRVVGHRSQLRFPFRIVADSKMLAPRR